ncbi:MAG TPA: DNA primase small subunit domain-containing protein [Candidatus Nanoarchaeia archaeon]|nr:DNA primase small subunit domain-containing protein [Candidatus Nanoarchaeia archaeon]
MDERVLKFYARKDVQQAIAALAKDREVGVMYGLQNFGKRPQIIQYPSDIYEFAKEGATSFHMSEERWKDPMQLKAGLSRKQLDELRMGWDIVIDIDTNFLEYSKTTAELLVEALKFNNVKTIGLKFSGRSGFHLLVPFESLPPTVNNEETRLLFPEGLKTIAQYLKMIIQKPLTDRLLSMNTVEQIIKSSGKKEEEVMVNGKLNPFSLVDIDNVAISSRHMFRSVFSINEKSGMVSVPVKPEQVKNFSLKQAKIENVDTSIPFLKVPEQAEAKQLIIVAFDKVIQPTYTAYNQKEEDNKKEKKYDPYEIPKEKIKPDYFPPCIHLALKGLQTDGRKRAIFILTNFLTHMGYTPEEIQQQLLEWNQKNYEPLRDGMIISHVKWHKNAAQTILPPNCDNEAYYKTIGICKPDNWCSKIRNPVQYVRYRLKIEKQNEKKPRGRKPKVKVAKEIKRQEKIANKTE